MRDRRELVNLLKRVLGLASGDQDRKKEERKEELMYRNK